MDLPVLRSYEDQAIDTVVYVLNKATATLGFRMNLSEFAQTREVFAAQAKVSLARLRIPITITSESLIVEIIEKKWRLTSNLYYTLMYQGISRDQSTQYYYYEAIFSQPTVSYPIPQATVSVFFRVEDKHVEPKETRGLPMMYFRIEGQHTDHDVRYVTLTLEWILAVIKMKIKLFERIEAMRLF